MFNFRRSRDPVGPFQRSLLLLGALLLAGTAGYHQLEGMSAVDSLYMTVITLTTVGFQEVQPLSASGRLFTIALILVGVGVVAWVARNAVEISLSEQLWSSMSKRRVKHMIEKLSDHYIVCGCGRMGHAIIEEFQRYGAPFVIVESNVAKTEEFLEMGFPFIQGNATSDEVLLQAGIERAKGVISVVDRDADSVLVAITAKALNPRVTVVARAATDEAARKLRLAGADEVLSPYAIGGQRLALSILRPTVTEFLARLVYNEEDKTELEEVYVSEGSEWVGKLLAETKMRGQFGAIVVGIRTSAGELIFGPSAGQTISAGDALVIVVREDQLPALRAAAKG